ncbi:MAG: type II toxin-antitoxin system RatA family toxin [Alphaproteobacteria bacterium]|nr:type II toxin-antitoxin system RatA family toxin [Alphaproteobacteria bacterium]
MPRHYEQKQLPYSPEQMFALVADIERYPEFLPWCRSARVRARQGNVATAEMRVGFKGFYETFVTTAALKEPESIGVNYVAGPLSHLSNEWRFKEGEKGGCEVTFFVDFGFRSLLLSALMEAVFDKAFRKMVAAFEARARELYG